MSAFPPAPRRRRPGFAIACAFALATGLAFLPTLSAAEPATFLPDAEVLARATTLPVEERRYLVYLNARLNKPHLAQSLADGILAETPRDRQTLLVLASMYVEQKDPHAVLRIARRFLEFYPGDHQGRYFLGAGHYLAKEFAAANAVLRDLKREQFASRKYPYETDLAASAYAAGDWYRAMLSYQELLRHHTLGDELRDEVRRVLDEIYRTHLPRVEVSAAQTRLDLARASRTVAMTGQHVDDRHWLEARYHRDEIVLEPAPGLRAARSSRSEMAGSLVTIHDSRWRSEISAGGSEAGFTAGARLRYLFAKEREVTLEYFFNERATDSLVLEALDGRQHRLGPVVNWLIEADLSLVARAQFRTLHAGGQRLGHGFGLDVNLDQTITRLGHGPRVIVGYRGSVAWFSPASAVDSTFATELADPAGGQPGRDAIVASFVSRRIDRHGAGVQLTDNLADAWIYRLNGGVDYDFELSSVNWNASLSLSFFPRKSIELLAEAGYTSSAGASNAGSAAKVFNLLLRSFY